MDFLPVILIYPARPLHSFRVDPRRMGGVVFQWWCTGQPAFIRMNLRDDKISPVTQLGYEIRVLIEFSGAGQGCEALNIIEFDRLMKRAPTLVMLLPTGPIERCPHPPCADAQPSLFL